MRKTFQYRIYPTKKQITTLNRILEECRWVYNQTLELRKDAWEQRQESISLYKTNKVLTIWKSERPSLNDVFSQSLQNVQQRVDLAFKAFFRRVKAGGEEPGYPRFKGFGRYDSITYPQFGFSIEGNSVKASKIGTIPMKLHRPVVGEIKTLTIRKTSTGKWFTSFSCEVENTPLKSCDKAVGIDVGLTTFATFSDGKKIKNPRFFRTDEKRLSKYQSKRDKSPKGSPRRRKYGKIVSHIHENIANRRKDFSHQESRKLINEYGIICFEKLNIKDMMSNHKLAKSIGDVAWNQFISYTICKAEEAGRRVVLVDPKNTTKRCSRCGTLVDKTLSDRIHKCPTCGLVIDRDLNASINILALGLQSMGKTPRCPVIYSGE